MALKVTVWGTGKIGRPTIRSVLSHKGLELVAVIASNPDKSVKIRETSRESIRSLALKLPIIRMNINVSGRKTGVIDLHIKAVSNQYAKAIILKN